jgi:hypothetical protein
VNLFLHWCSFTIVSLEKVKRKKGKKTFEAMKVLPIFLFLVFSLHLADAFTEQSEQFVQCLKRNSDNSTAISQIIYTPNNPSFTKILTMYIRNLRYQTPETPKPLAILTPSHESQVQTAIYCSKAAGLQIRIRSGGNDIEGSSYVSYLPFFILDLFGFQSISIDTTTNTAWVGAGATLGELYYAINRTDSTLAFPAGYWPTVGVGGHICSGGWGGLLRKYGVSADNVVDARIIDANGRILDRKSMGEDLFWAIRGGSCASFGVVISFKLKLVRVPKSVTAFTVTRSLEQDATNLIYKWQFIAPSMPRDLAISLQLVNNLLSNTTKQTVLATFVASFLGDMDDLISLMDQHFPELGVTKTDCTTVSWVDYNLYHFGFPLQNIAQILLSRTPPGFIPYLKIKPDFVQRPIPKKGLKRIFDLMKQVPTGESQMEWTPFGGKMEEISESSIPFPHRKGNSFLMEKRMAWSDSDPAATMERLGWERKLHKIVGYYVASNPRRAYVNYRDYDLGVNNNIGPTSLEQTKRWGLPYYKGNFDRLVRIKTVVDPENYFNYQQSFQVLPLHSSE